MLKGTEFYLAYFAMFLCTVAGGGWVAYRSWHLQTREARTRVPTGLRALTAGIASCAASVFIFLAAFFLIPRSGFLFSLAFGAFQITVLGTVICIWLTVLASNLPSAGRSSLISFGSIALAVIDSLCLADMTSNHVSW